MSIEDLAKEALKETHGCIHCSYLGDCIYKLCDECLARWLEENGYDMAGNRIE
jgi:hypothetical protein